MWPDTRGAPSPTIRPRTFDHMPSQPISARPRTSSPPSSRIATRVAFVDEIVDLAVVFQRDEVVALAGPQIDAVDVGAMGHRIGLAEAFHEGLAERNAGDEAAAERIAHLDSRRHPGIVHHAGLEPDPLDRPEDVGPELDAGAEFLEFRRLLEHPHRKALARQCIGSDQPADAAARDEEGKVVPVRLGHGLTPPLPRKTDAQPVRFAAPHYQGKELDWSSNRCGLIDAMRGGLRQLRESLGAMEEQMAFDFKINGNAAQSDAPPHTPLLWVIREELKLTGTKFGCGTGLCGACMVHIDGKRAFSCQTQMSQSLARP